jgi:hypothetical protein
MVADGSSGNGPSAYGVNSYLELNIPDANRSEKSVR